MEININEINLRTKENVVGFIEEANKKYFDRLYEFAKSVYDGRYERPIILLSGPSGSGKTTTAHILESYLDNMGVETHTLSMDNYFHTLSPEERKGAKEGTINLEAPERVNIELLNSQLEDIINCKPVELPVYDFPTSTNKPSGKIFTRKADELVIVEGIHALNPSVITIPDDKTVKLYVSVRTRVVCDGHTIHPENIRLLRRMIRDNITRGRSFSQTCNAAEHVKKGENLYIMPYKYRVDFDIDTFFPYELGVYKTFFSTQLDSTDIHKEMEEVLCLINPVLSIKESLIPKNSLIREFIGDMKI